MLANLFVGGSGGGTAVNSRAKRVQQLRQQRLAAAAHNGKSTNDDPTSAPKIQTDKKTDQEEEVLVVSGMCTILCALAIVALGAAMATLFFLLHKPDCIRGVLPAPSSPSSASSSSSSGVRRMKEMAVAIPEEDVPVDAISDTNTAIQAASAAIAKATPNLTPLRGIGGGGGDDSSTGGGGTLTAPESRMVPPEDLFPPQCTAEQFERLSIQLPAGGCQRNKYKPWRRTSCSFSLATSCSDGAWFKRYYADHPPTDGPLTSIIVGCNKGYQAIDLLALGTQDATSYDRKTWQHHFTTDAPLPVSDGSSDTCPRASTESTRKDVTANDSGSDVYCIEPVASTFHRLVETKLKMGIGDQLHLEQLVISNTADEMLVHKGDKIGVEGAGIANWQMTCSNDQTKDDCTKVPVNTLDHFVSTQTDLAGDGPIHFVSLGLEGFDYLALVGAVKSFKRIHYMELQYHWFGDWGAQSLKDMVSRMKRKNFVCYFAGDNKLWRLTDCFQEHYEYRFYANIACVNVELASGLAAEMETIFQQTLQQTLTFGEK